MRVINHNWSATKQCLHPQSVAEISRHSVLSADRIQQCETSSGSHHETQISVCKSPFPSASTALSLFRAKTVQQRPLLPREVETSCNDRHNKPRPLHYVASLTTTLWLAALCQYSLDGVTQQYFVAFGTSRHFLSE